MAVATGRSNWKDGASGGKRGSLPGPMGRPDYGPYSARVVIPPDDCLFSAVNDPPKRIGRRGRKMTDVDFQVVALYTDLSRRDIGYLQSIARVYDVTQMRELIQCRLNHMGRKKRCLDVTRHEDYNVYGGYLESKYGERMPELMPLIHDQPIRHKPRSRVFEFPTIRHQGATRPRNTSRKDSRQPKTLAQEESDHRDSNKGVRGSDVPKLEEKKQVRKTSIKKGTAAGKSEEVEPTLGEGKGDPSGATSGTVTKRSSKTTPAQRKSQGTKEATEMVDAKEKTKGEKTEGLKAAPKKAAASKKAAATKTGVSGDVVAAEDGYTGEKFEEPSGSDENTPEIAKSESLDIGGVFSPEYDEATGQARVKSDEEEEDVEDKPADNTRPAEPASQMDDETMKQLEQAPVLLFEGDDEMVQVFPTLAPSSVEQETFDAEELTETTTDDVLSKNRVRAKESKSREEQERKEALERQELGGEEEEWQYIEEIPSCIF